MHEGFKLVQFSSMFINEDGIHDSNAARYMGETLVEQAFRNLTPLSHIFDNPEPLSQLWLDLLHVDDDSWHFDEEKEISGNTPNLRITLDDRYEGAILVPQGWINKTSDPKEDNVGLWIHDDGNASLSWRKGQEGQVGYWLLAQDNPPEIP